MPAEIRDAAFARMQTCAHATKAEKLGLLALFWYAWPTAKKVSKEGGCVGSQCSCLNYRRSSECVGALCSDSTDGIC